MTLPPDPWAHLSRLTPARIALGRTGSSLPTREVLAFARAHALARDAVVTPLDVDAVLEALTAWGLPAVTVESAAPDRATYLRRPDLGRRLSDTSREQLATVGSGPVDVAIVIADGLSSPAVQSHAVPLVKALQPAIRQAGWTLAPIVVARQARVALGDEVGELLAANLMILLVGERPGLSSPDSLGAYVTFAPRVGRTDAERNCVSNIRAEGLAYDTAATTIAWLAQSGLRLRRTGIGLKDRSGHASRAALSPASDFPKEDDRSGEAC